MEKYFHPTLYNECNNLSVSKKKVTGNTLCLWNDAKKNVDGHCEAHDIVRIVPVM